MTIASIMGMATFLIGVPAVTGVLFAMPHLRRLMLTIMIFSTCHIKKPFYMEVFFEAYRGVDRGFGVTIPDLFFFGFFFWFLMGGSRQKLILWPCNMTLWSLMIIISILSLTASSVAYYGLFTVHKYIRGLVLLWVMVNVVRDRKDVEAVMTGLMAAVIFQGGVVFWD